MVRNEASGLNEDLGGRHNTSCSSRDGMEWLGSAGTHAVVAGDLGNSRATEGVHGLGVNGLTADAGGAQLLVEYLSRKTFYLMLISSRSSGRRWDLMLQHKPMMAKEVGERGACGGLGVGLEADRLESGLATEHSSVLQESATRCLTGNPSPP